MENCYTCKYCKEYKIHQRVVKYHPGDYVDEHGITHRYRKSGTIYVGLDMTEFEDITICERLKCEPHDDNGCELWEKENDKNET